MTRMHSRLKQADFKAELEVGGDAVRELVRSALQEILEEEMTEALGAEKRASGLRVVRATDQATASGF